MPLIALATVWLTTTASVVPVPPVSDDKRLPAAATGIRPDTRAKTEGSQPALAPATTPRKKNPDNDEPSCDE